MSLIEIIVLPMLMGGIGGLGHILVFKDGEFTLPRKFVTDEGEKHYIFGSSKDIIIGIIAGFLSVLPVMDTVPVWYVIYISLVSGIGGSSVITRKLEQNLECTRQHYLGEISRYQFETASHQGSTIHNEVNTVGDVERRESEN
ncbi:DUF4257 domain-containing protein [Falsibacillus pallidus]|uniref:Uncharacterized protein DUF4257 n=1 Tax=Falsibacillus pallidus TaxID=493781 RepID=A0A370G6H8_9BACI|nr:DUF4257 domain-containing protein [Falsibacillus pallidus]RDI38469.1 uncharacterized protein DUF4257 [Falsibacillus pallidus]